MNERHAVGPCVPQEHGHAIGDADHEHLLAFAGPQSVRLGGLGLRRLGCDDTVAMHLMQAVPGGALQLQRPAQRFTVGFHILGSVAGGKAEVERVVRRLALAADTCRHHGVKPWPA